MNYKIEVKYLLFIIVISLTTSIFFTGVNFSRPIEIIVHDIYFVVDSGPLWGFIFIQALVVYFFSVGLKLLGKQKGLPRVISLVICTILTFVMTLSFTVILFVIATQQDFLPLSFIFGFLVLFFGFAVLFALRAREVLKIDDLK